MTNAILVFLTLLSSWGGGLTSGETDMPSIEGRDCRPLVVVNPYVRQNATTEYARQFPPVGSVPLRIRNPFVQTEENRTEANSVSDGSGIGHVWGRFTAVRVYPSQMK